MGIKLADEAGTSEAENQEGLYAQRRQASGGSLSVGPQTDRQAGTQADRQTDCLTLAFCVLTYSTLKYPPKCAPAGTVDEHLVGYLNKKQ